MSVKITTVLIEDQLDPSKPRYTMPYPTALLRALDGEVRFVNTEGTVEALIQAKIDRLRANIPHLTEEELELIEERKHPEHWKAVSEALDPILLSLFSQSMMLDMPTIRRACESDPFLCKFPNSIGQRIREKVKEGKLLRLEGEDGKEVPGFYLKGKTLLGRPT